LLRLERQWLIATAREIEGAKRDCQVPGSLFTRRLKPLSAARPNRDCRNVFHIDKRIEEFCASQMRKMDDLVGNLRNLATDFFSRTQMQLDSFAGAALEDAEDGRIGLQTDFVLGE
jgi:hypothetical protein